MTRIRPARAVLLVIVAGTLLRVILALVLGLAVDESYTVAISRQLSLSYFDHPPLSFWIPGVIERVTGTNAALALRLPFIALFAGTTWLMYRLTARWWGERAGFYAALLLNIAPVFSLSTGGWVLPDGPLEFAMLASVYCLAPVLVEAGGGRRDAGRVPAASVWPWVGGALFAGMAFLSKYHAVFLVFGVLLFMVTQPEARRWFARPEPYVAAALSLCFLIPVLLWNWQHSFASFRFQGGRGVPHHGLHVTPLLQNVAGQAGYLLPWLWLPLVWQLFRGLRMGPSHPRRWLCVCLAIGPIAVFTLVSLGGNPGLPHWPAPGYLFLFPTLGLAAAEWEARNAPRAHRWIGAAAAAFVVLVGIAASQIATGWVSRLQPRWFAKGDPSLEALDWHDLPAAIAAADSGRPPAFVATTHWIDAAKVGYIMGPRVPVLCLTDDPRHFAYLYDERDFAEGTGVLVVRASRDRTPQELALENASRFGAIAYAGPAAITRLGQPVITLWLYRVSHPGAKPMPSHD